MTLVLLRVASIPVLLGLAACTHLDGNRQVSCGTIAGPEPQLLNQGYYAVLRRCEYVYCHNGPATGTQLRVRECSTAAELHQKAQDAKDIFRRQAERPMTCTSTGCR